MCSFARLHLPGRSKCKQILIAKKYVFFSKICQTYTNFNLRSVMLSLSDDIIRKCISSDVSFFQFCRTEWIHIHASRPISLLTRGHAIRIVFSYMQMNKICRKNATLSAVFSKKSDHFTIPGMRSNHTQISQFVIEI